MPQKIGLNPDDKDIDFVLDPDFGGGHSIENYMWSGCRATYGVKRGKVAFQVRIDNGSLCRIGWGTPSASLVLGQCDQSFGYGGTGKKSHNNIFVEYGDKYGRGDCITALIDADGGSIAFMKNGKWMGAAFCIPERLLGVPFFPHVLIKDTHLTINFGDKDRHKLPSLPDGYRYICHAEELVESPWKSIRSEDKKLSETDYADLENPAEPDVIYSAAPDLRGGGPGQKRLIMLVGLPCSGKTFWAKKFIQQHPHMKFQILSVNLIMERKMPNTKHMFEERFQKLVKEATDTLNQMLKIASQENGNIIWDQTNVNPIARKRKLAEFKGFRKTAVVFLPDENTMSIWRTRQYEQTGQRAPDQVIAEMQRAFQLPEVGDECGFDEIVYAFGNSPSNRRELMQKYKADADAFFRGEKKRYLDTPSEGTPFDKMLRKDDYCKSYGERQFTASNPYKPELPYNIIYQPTPPELTKQDKKVKGGKSGYAQNDKPAPEYLNVDDDEEEINNLEEQTICADIKQAQSYQSQYLRFVYSN